MMRRLGTGWLVLLFGLFGRAAFGADAAYLAELVDTARERRLAEHPVWLRLVHYEADLLHGHTSRADSPAFFNADNGKTNPAAELEATLRSFFSEQAESDRSQNPQCAFIARYRWLKSQLDFDPRRLPEQPCRRFETWVAAINPAQVTLIFPAAYINSPSSMFGHTLIRIDQPDQDERTRLISYAINFAAQTDETNGLVFAVRGIAGGYPGYFSIMPYYEKVKEYNDLENRDIWEYQLEFTDAEIRRLLEHAWELGPVAFDYYFFDENCSYMLLSLLEVARPNLELTRRFPLYATPSDTVRVLLEEKGLLKKVVYRPSNRTRIEHRLAQLDVGQEELVAALVAGAEGLRRDEYRTLAEREKAQVLDVAHDYVRYQLYDGQREREDAAALLLALLRERSDLPRGEVYAPPPQPRVRPDEGHETARLVLAGGSRDGSGYAELKARPAYHDLLDPAPGYVAGAQINFLDLTLRHYPESGRTEVERLDVIDVLSLTPRSRFFKPWSWRVKTGLERRNLPGEAQRRLFYFLTAGGGISQPIGRHAAVFGLVEAQGVGHESIDRGYALGGGLHLGLLWRITDGWRLLAQGLRYEYPEKTLHDHVEYGMEQSLALGKDLALRLNLKAVGPVDDPASESTLSLHWYF